jgi:hypothetical protein
MLMALKDSGHPDAARITEAIGLGVRTCSARSIAALLLIRWLKYLDSRDSYP